MIWQYALPEPRLIEDWTQQIPNCLVARCPMFTRCEHCPPLGASSDKEPWRGISPLNYVCHESRLVAKKEHFEYCLNTSPAESKNIWGMSPAEFEALRTEQSSHFCTEVTIGVRFRPDKDTIYFRKAENGIRFTIYRHQIGDLGLSNIKSIAMDESLYPSLGTSLFKGVDDKPAMLGNESRLEELILLRDQPHPDTEGNQLIGA